MPEVPEKLPFAKNFSDFIVYQQAFEVALVVHVVSLEFPKHEQFKGIADQMRRASKGICANIAEGHGKASYPAEWKRFLMMALGSAQEMLVWIGFARKLSYMDDAKAHEWEMTYMEISRILKALIQKVAK